ncbi:MAG: putative toxin-antitoxin system toxin component, PIN family [Oscillospiraceae bacterium]|jgi:putative PIN family toxin of toxin-antitoxin system|nr:putative toxin-antitoxin system toxin component, PIN family [Oscillospiraceae bacterium]
MRVLVDTNVLFSALLFPNSTPAKAIQRLCETETMVLCDYVIREMFDIIARKRPDLLADAEVMLAQLQYEGVIAPREPSKLIADPKDAPILNAAIIADVDIIISGDKHFLSLDMERPKVMTAASYMEQSGEKN